MPDLKICPQCGKLMTQDWTDEIFLSDPPVRIYIWICDCGHIEPGGKELVQPFVLNLPTNKSE